MTRLGAVVFPARYNGPDGLLRAEHDLERLTVLHNAYALQPNITPVWQGYIDRTARDVACQHAVVSRLRAQQVAKLATAAEKAGVRIA
jgi:hypothetical protein